MLSRRQMAWTKGDCYKVDHKQTWKKEEARVALEEAAQRRGTCSWSGSLDCEGIHTSAFRLLPLQPSPPTLQLERLDVGIDANLGGARRQPLLNLAQQAVELPRSLAFPTWRTERGGCRDALLRNALRRVRRNVARSAALSVSLPQAGARKRWTRCRGASLH